MELWQNDINDYEYYAFLLGSSLRNNNLEQFFNIYDTILPKHLSDARVSSFILLLAKGSPAFATYFNTTYIAFRLTTHNYNNVTMLTLSYISPEHVK